MATSIVEVLSAYQGDKLPDGTFPFPGGLYKPTGRLKEANLVTITPTGETREHRMSEIDLADIKIFADELDIALKLQNPLVQSLFAKNAVALVNLVRTVNTETASGFKGSGGSGRQLDALLLRAEQFGDPDVAAAPPATQGPRASWIRAVGIGLNVQFIIADDLLGANVHGDLAMSPFEGLAILGLANPAATPCVDAVQLRYLAQDYNIQNADFEMANPFIGDVICELKQPMIIYPQETGRINARYFLAGQDEMRPIGIWIKMSTAIRALATS